MLRWFILWEDELPQSRLRRARFPFLSLCDIFPRPGEVVLWDGAFGMAAQFPAKPQSLPLPLKPSPLGGKVARSAG